MNVNLSEKECIKRFIGEKSSEEIRERINIIKKENISVLFDLKTLNCIYSESYGVMHFNFVTIKKLKIKESLFIKTLLPIIAKLVHPNIQIFYGLMLDEESICIVLEYVTSINMDDLFYLKKILSQREEIALKLEILTRIAITLDFLYKRNCPYLVLNCRNVKLNYKLLTDKHQHLKVIYCNNSYIRDNLVKLTEIGSYLKYDRTFREFFSILNEDIYQLCYHPPELIKFINNKEESGMSLPAIIEMENFDVWSFGCLMLEVFSGIAPYADISDKREILLAIENERNFYLTNINQMKKIEYDLYEFKDISEGVVDIIKMCTDYDCVKRPKLSLVIKMLLDVEEGFKRNYFDEKEIKEIKDKVNAQDFQYYHLEKFKEINLLEQQIKLSLKLDEELKATEDKLNSFK